MDRYVNIMSKVSPTTARRLDGICARYRFRSKYEILQFLVASFLRYIDADEDGCVTDELASLFETISSDERFGGVKSDHALQADHLILTLGTSCIVADIRDGRIVRTSTQVARAYDAVTSLTPSISSRLRGVRQRYGLPNAMEAVRMAVAGEAEADPIAEEIRDEFSGHAVADRSAYHVGGPKPKRAPNERKLR